jgi:hypothetical protein
VEVDAAIATAKRGWPKGLPDPNPPDQATFGGVKAKTADLKLQRIAQDMEKAGASRDQIWKETGWFKGVDGKWRFEIDDSGAAVKLQDGVFGSRQSVGQLKDGVDHSQFFDAYPEMRDVDTNLRTFGNDPTRPEGYKPTERGSYETSKFRTPRLTAFGEAESDIRSIALHEGQHGVQNIEGFARGGMPETALEDRLKEINDELTRLSRGMDNRRAYRFDTGIDTKAVEAEIAGDEAAV